MEMEPINLYAAPHSEVGIACPKEYGTVNLLSIRGRLGRARYISNLALLVLCTWIVAFLLTSAIIFLTRDYGDRISLTYAVKSVYVMYGAVLIFSFVLAIQRAHDFNMSGWICLLLFVPFVNFIFAFALWLVPGTTGENKYGRETPPNGIFVKIIAVLAPIAIVIMIGILAAIAIPEYLAYQRKIQETTHAK